MFSKSCEYGIKAVIFIAQQSSQQKRVKLGDIATAINSPEAFTAKTLQLLSRNNVIQAVKGAYGGYEMSDAKIKETNLYQIVKIIDGDTLFNRCALGLTACNDETPCPIHKDFLKIKADLNKMLKSTYVISLASNLDQGITHLNILNIT